MEEATPSNEASPPTKDSAVEGSSPEDLELPQLGILVGLGQRSLANLASFGQYHRFPAGVEIIREGEVQDRFYVVVSGELAVVSLSAGKEVPLTTAKQGECLGEVSLLEPGPASASVRIVKDATLWSMDMSELREYLMDNTGDAGIMLMGMASCLSYRLRRANELIRQHHVVPTQALPRSREQAITAGNTPVNLGFFERLKKAVGGDKDKKIRISTKIKM